MKLSTQDSEMIINDEESGCKFDGRNWIIRTTCVVNFSQGKVARVLFCNMLCRMILEVVKVLIRLASQTLYLITMLSQLDQVKCLVCVTKS